MTDRRSTGFVDIDRLSSLQYLLIHISWGMWLLNFQERFLNDLFLRWREIRYFFAGVNPYDLSDALWQNERGANMTGTAIDPNLGATSVGSG